MTSCPAPDLHTPLISVIVPIYNVAAHVGACVQSILDQTLADFEVILIDDGATDGSGDIAMATAQDDPRVRLIRQENAGLGAARNTGLAAAAGTFIAFVDSDDTLMPDYLMRLWQTLEHTGGDWVACAIQSNEIAPSDPSISTSFHSAIHGQADLFMHGVPRRYGFDSWSDVVAHFPSAWNKLYRRSLIDGLRFDEDTWFEDHGFFHRAAARTDHIIHLPEALYIQTRGRVGQITNQDTDRVFEQFDVLDTMAQQFAQGPHAGADIALARIASRLLFERSTVIFDQSRRTRFATAARDWLVAHGLDYTPDWDPDIGLGWAAELAGDLPLSVIMGWDGTAPDALQDSLDALRLQSAPGHEVVIVCQNDAALRTARTLQSDATTAGTPWPDHWHLHSAPDNCAQGGALNHGLTLARGAYVVFLLSGDRPTPWSLLHNTESMIRADADFGVSPMALQPLEADPQDTAAFTHHNGMHDMALWPQGTPPAGPLELTPLQALGLEAHCSAKIFRRTFLTDKGLTCTLGPRFDWALCLNAALMAPVTIYIDRISVIVPMRAQGMTRWQTPYGARALLQGHKALLAAVTRSLPASALERLPQGWQRKLFARALREQVYFGNYKQRLGRAMMVTGAAAISWKDGYGPARTAGLDPSVGPRLAQLLNPLSLARRILLRSIRAKNIAVDTSTNPNATAPDTLHAFDVQGTAQITLCVAFHDANYGNIYFRATPRGPSLFHLSLRHAENIMVCNSQTSAGHWRAELPYPVDLSAEFAHVTVTFSPNRVQVTVNEQLLCDLEATKNSRFAGLQDIAGFDYEGNVRPASVMPCLPASGLTLDNRLTLRSASYGPAAVLHLDQSDTVLPLIAGPMESGTALFPARLWRDADPDRGLTFTLGSNTSLTISRNDLLTRIEHLLQLPLSYDDSPLCLTVLEHVRYAALGNLLSAPARHRLNQIATFYRVQDFLYADTSELETPPAVLGGFANDNIAREVATVTIRLAQSQNTPDSITPDPLHVLAKMHVSPQASPLLFLTLAEYFCADNRDFDGLFRLAQERSLLPIEGPDTLWAISATLPFHMAAQDYERVCRDLQELTAPSENIWLVTAGIAWTLRRALEDTNIPATTRHQIVAAFRELVLTRSDIYWERMHCREMTRAAASLILHRHQLDAEAQRENVALCLRVYGLSRQFWEDLSHVPDLPAEIAQAQAAFDVLTQSDSTSQDCARALELFETAGATDAARLRRELFGPAGLPRLMGKDPAQEPLDIADLAQMHPDAPATAALRHMASPGAAPVSPAFADLARTAFTQLDTETPPAPAPDTQLLLSKTLAQTDTEITAILAPMAQLADVTSGHLGLGMALALIDRTHDTNPEHVLLLCDWVQAQIALQPEDTWRSAPAVIQPLRRLHTRASLCAPVQHLLEHLDITPPPIEATDNAGLPAGNPVFDTVVTVFSCHPYLETRIPALRAGWLSLLEKLGVPYVIVVGDGDNTLRGDVLYLDAPDDYEGLPQKTLAVINWVHNHTRFGHMLKIDDDCFLNAPLFFGALNYRKFDYYGRCLLRKTGQMDRRWHQEKSTSARGQMDLDKSPEPSLYADGGSAYTLSRTAMAAALQAAASPHGQHLIATSFMEDKLLGDLLSQQGIRPKDEGYHVYIRRRTFGNATPVAQWRNSFFASQTAPVHLTHLDTHIGQDAALTCLKTPDLLPRKIWPSYQDAKLGYQSNALELISDEASVVRAQDAQVAVVACMRNEMFMLPHFLAHYRKLGVQAFLIADNLSDDGTREYLLEQPDVALFSVDTDYRLSHYGVAWQQAMMAAYRTGKWSLVADADELLVWQKEQTQTLDELLEEPEFENADAARIFMLDMYPRGPLEDADFKTDTFKIGTPFDQAGFADRTPFLRNTLSRGPYSNQDCWTSALRHRLIPGSSPNLFVAQKLALLRYQPWMRLSAGLHFVSDTKIASRDLLFAHFKYNADFRRKVQAEVLRGQHFNDAEEYHKYQALMSEGRSQIHDPDLSMPWAQVPFVKRLLS